MPPPQQHLLSPGESIKCLCSFLRQTFLVVLVFLTFVVPLGSPPSSSSWSSRNGFEGGGGVQAQSLKKPSEQQSSQQSPSSSYQHHHHHSSSPFTSQEVPCPEATRWPDFCGPLFNTSILNETSQRDFRLHIFEAQSMFCDIVRILNKIDCAQPFTVSPKWRLGCQEAYRDWSCSILVEPYMPAGLHSCDSTCHNVIRNCPYLSPDRVQADLNGRPALHPSQYGGHPAFFCPTTSLVNHQSEHTEDFFFFWDDASALTCIIFNPSEAGLTWDSFPLTTIDLTKTNFTFCHEFGSTTGDNANVILPGEVEGQDPSVSLLASSLFPDLKQVNVSNCCWTYSSALPQLYTALASTLRRKELASVNCVDLVSPEESSHLHEEISKPEESIDILLQNQVVLQCFVGQESPPPPSKSDSSYPASSSSSSWLPGHQHNYPSGANNIYDSDKFDAHYYDTYNEHHYYSHDDNLVASSFHGRPTKSKPSVRVRRVDNDAVEVGAEQDVVVEDPSYQVESYLSSTNNNNGAEELEDVSSNSRHSSSKKVSKHRISSDSSRSASDKFISGDKSSNLVVSSRKRIESSDQEDRDHTPPEERGSSPLSSSYNLLLEDEEEDEDYIDDEEDEGTTESAFLSSASDFSTDDFITMVTVPTHRGKRKVDLEYLESGEEDSAVTAAVSSGASRLRPPGFSSSTSSILFFFVQSWSWSKCCSSSWSWWCWRWSNNSSRTLQSQFQYQQQSCCYFLYSVYSWLFLLLLISSSLITLLTVRILPTTNLLPILVNSLLLKLGVQLQDNRVIPKMNSSTGLRLSLQEQCCNDDVDNGESSRIFGDERESSLGESDSERTLCTQVQPVKVGNRRCKEQHDYELPAIKLVVVVIIKVAIIIVLIIEERRRRRQNLNPTICCYDYSYLRSRGRRRRLREMQGGSWENANSSYLQVEPAPSSVIATPLTTVLPTQLIQEALSSSSHLPDFNRSSVKAKSTRRLITDTASHRPILPSLSINIMQISSRRRFFVVLVECKLLLLLNILLLRLNVDDNEKEEKLVFVTNYGDSSSSSRLLPHCIRPIILDLNLTDSTCYYYEYCGRTSYSCLLMISDDDRRRSGLEFTSLLLLKLLLLRLIRLHLIFIIVKKQKKVTKYRKRNQSWNYSYYNSNCDCCYLLRLIARRNHYCSREYTVNYYDGRNLLLELQLLKVRHSYRIRPRHYFNCSKENIYNMQQLLTINTARTIIVDDNQICNSQMQATRIGLTMTTMRRQKYCPRGQRSRPLTMTRPPEPLLLAAYCCDCRHCCRHRRCSCCSCCRCDSKERISNCCKSKNTRERTAAAKAIEITYLYYYSYCCKMIVVKVELIQNASILLLLLLLLLMRLLIIVNNRLRLSCTEAST